MTAYCSRGQSNKAPPSSFPACLIIHQAVLCDALVLHFACLIADDGSVVLVAAAMHHRSCTAADDV